MSGSSGTIGLHIPRAIMPAGAADPSNLLKPLNLDSSGNLRVTGSITASNPSVGPNGSPAPVQSTEIGFIDGSGNLTGVSPTTPLPVTGTFTPSGLQNVNLADVAGVATPVGAGASNAGTQRVILSSDSPLATGAATAANQSTGNAALSAFSAKSASAFINVPFDETVLTYVGATSNIDTVTYKLAGVTVNTLTLSYDGSNRLIDVVKT